MIQKAGISLCHIAFRGYHDALQLSSQDLDQAAHASRKCEGGGIRLYTSENLLIQLRYSLAKLSTFYSAKADHPQTHPHPHPRAWRDLSACYATRIFPSLS